MLHDYLDISVELPAFVVSLPENTATGSLLWEDRLGNDWCHLTAMFKKCQTAVSLFKAEVPRACTIMVRLVFFCNKFSSKLLQLGYRCHIEEWQKVSLWSSKMGTMTGTELDFSGQHFIPQHSANGVFINSNNWRCDNKKKECTCALDSVSQWMGSTVLLVSQVLLVFTYWLSITPQWFPSLTCAAFAVDWWKALTMSDQVEQVNGLSNICWLESRLIKILKTALQLRLQHSRLLLHCHQHHMTKHCTDLWLPHPSSIVVHIIIIWSHSTSLWGCGWAAQGGQSYNLPWCY